ncbi:hypothetical protein [Solwaraspora sp. WMMA2101]|uniref:hypothetical protein n=1 Tax=Solwaraspora sp. WMMA2101 TaxID=3404124 RepID=UPI003B9228CA
MVAAADEPPLLSMLASILLPEVVVIGLMCIGPAVIPRLAALLAGPFVGRDVTARMAHDEVRAAARTTAAVAAPVLANSAIAGSLLLTLSLTADWATVQNRARLYAPLVVEVGSPAAAASVAADRTVATADVRRLAMLVHDDDGSPGEPDRVEVVDLVTASVARGLAATRGTLDDFHGRAVAVTATWVTDAGVDLGGTVPVWIDGERVLLRVVAVLPDLPGLRHRSAAGRCHHGADGLARPPRHHGRPGRRHRRAHHDPVAAAARHRRHLPAAHGRGGDGRHPYPEGTAPCRRPGLTDRSRRWSGRFG